MIESRHPFVDCSNNVMNEINKGNDSSVRLGKNEKRNSKTVSEPQSDSESDRENDFNYLLREVTKEKTINRKLQQQLQEKDEALKRQQKQFDHTEHRNNELESELEDQESSFRQYRKEVETANRRIHLFERENEELRKENESLREKINHEEKAHKNKTNILEKEISHLSSQLDLKSVQCIEFSRIQQDFVNLENQNKDLETELLGAVEEKRLMRFDLEQKIEMLTDQLGDYQSIKETNKEQISTLQRKCNDLKDDLEAAKSFQRQNQQRNTTIEDEISLMDELTVSDSMLDESMDSIETNKIEPNQSSYNNLAIQMKARDRAYLASRPSSLGSSRRTSRRNSVDNLSSAAFKDNSTSNTLSLKEIVENTIKYLQRFKTKELATYDPMEATSLFSHLMDSSFKVHQVITEGNQTSIQSVISVKENTFSLSPKASKVLQWVYRMSIILIILAGLLHVVLTNRQQYRPS